MHDDLLANSFERLLQAHCTARHVREIENGEAITTLWEAIEASGFADALAPESQGGAGLGLRDVYPMLFLCGRYAVPVPLAQTIVVRAALAAAGHTVLAGPITLAVGDLKTEDGGSITSHNVPMGRIAQWVLTFNRQSATLLPTASAKRDASGTCDGLTAEIVWPDMPQDAIQLDGDVDWRATGAAVFAVLLAGAMDRALELTVQYAADREQFGRPIGKFQAIQQQISVMAEQTCAAKMAAEMGCQSGDAIPHPVRAAVAKSRTSEAAALVAAIAHAVHGAIGVTEEFDLQLFTRRMYEWRGAFGAETYWNQRIGEDLIANESHRTVDFIRQQFDPSPNA